MEYIGVEVHFQQVARVGTPDSAMMASIATSIVARSIRA
jgi:hypothetical protein